MIPQWATKEDIERIRNLSSLAMLHSLKERGLCNDLTKVLNGNLAASTMPSIPAIKR